MAFAHGAVPRNPASPAPGPRLQRLAALEYRPSAEARAEQLNHSTSNLKEAPAHEHLMSGKSRQGALTLKGRNLQQPAALKQPEEEAPRH